MSGISIENWEDIQGWEKGNFSSKNAMEVGAGTLEAANLGNSTKRQARLTCPFHSKKELAHICFIVLHEHPTQPVHKWISGVQTPATTGATLSQGNLLVCDCSGLPGAWGRRHLCASAWSSNLRILACLTLATPSPFWMDIISQMNSRQPSFHVRHHILEQFRLKRGKAWLWRKRHLSPITEFLINSVLCN